MNKQGYTEVIVRFLRAILLVDVSVAVIVLIISILLDLHSLVAYGTLLVWASGALILAACILGIGRVSSRMADVGAYSVSGAGNMSENLQRIAEAGQGSVGCASLLLLAGVSLAIIGYILQGLPALLG